MSTRIAARDWEGADAALRQHEAAVGGGEPYVLVLRGVVATMRGDEASATLVFRQAADLLKDGIARYDLALVLLSRGNASEALRQLALARSEYDERGSPERKSTVLSLIEILDGTARMLVGDAVGARRALLAALELDPKSLRAGLLLRKLEEGGEQ
jgi:tetratricopeptide (TPR) repeat protein